ncbi:serine hydrolase [Geminocystis herdmanii]|uniref:serine hydrolase n=1 Tax=Geminocystis herdmanii TaxID=669359 RepID=UPI000348F713|nr:serine hydrolase [Geminocystis herdmanii]
MNKNQLKEKLKQLGKNKLSFLFPVITPCIAFIITIGLLITYNQNKEKNQTQVKSEKQINQKEQKKVTLEESPKIESKDSQITIGSENNLNSDLKENQLPHSFNVNPQQKELVSVEQKIINLAKQRNLPLEKLSFSLIDFSEYSCPLMKENRSPCYFKYQDNIPRYPASLVKLFWLVIAYAQNPNPDEQFKAHLTKMIVDSDNEDSSIVVDTISKTKSSKEKLPDTQFQQWKNNRENLNKFFNIPNLNISQKTFPIPYLQMDMPEGTDLQLRHPNGEEKPLRNYLTSQNIAILMYQIYAQQFPQSQAMLFLLKRDLNPSAWQNIPFNAIKGFLGEGIPDKNVQFYSKMGWTFSNRNDGAIIISPDGKTRYILVILGDDPAYYKDVEFMPIVSKMVYEEMSKLSNK